MARINIKDLPENMSISEELMIKIQGGTLIGPDVHLFRQASLWSPNIYSGRPVDPPPPTPSGGPKSYIR